jgi:tetratricopeptide (TPR) repeat protein
MMRNQAKYKAFISYSHVDVRKAQSLHRFIEGYSIPKRLVGRETSKGVIPRRLRPVFKDRDELPSASDLGTEINDALELSEHLIVICSPDSARSRWVNEEVLAYKRMGKASRILCIIFSGEPNATDMPGREAEECFCEALRFNVDENGLLTQERAEPVAADARLGGDGRYPARLKLVAGMLGIGLDDLRQRDMRRRHRRMVIVTAASVAGMALTLMLAWAASVARNDAERHREQADDLIGFMLGDLHERLNEVGRLDVLDSVSVKAMDYFENMKPRDLNEDALLGRAETLSQLGQVQLTRGHLGDAMTSFEEALRAVEELSARDPADLARLFELGQAHFWVGYVHWENNDFAAADKSMQTYYRISERLYNAEPENDDYILELGFAFNNLAILSNLRGDIKQALDYNQRMIDMSREVHERDRENETYLHALADAYSWSGSMLRRDGQLAASVERFGEYLQLVGEAGRSDPANTQWTEHRMIAHRFVADGELELGNTDMARSNFEAGMSLAKQLFEIEPTNKLWQVEHAMLVQRLALMDIRAGMSTQGLQLLESTRHGIQERLASSTDRDDWLMLGAGLDLVIGRVSLEAGNQAEAASIASAVVGVARQLFEQNPTVIMNRSLLVNSLIFEARIAAADPESPQENSKWQEVMAVIDETEKAQFFPEGLDAYVRASLYAGRRENIADKIRVLHDAAYQHPDFVTVLDEYGIDY